MSNNEFNRTTGTIRGLTVLGLEAMVGNVRVVLKPGDHSMPLPEIKIASEHAARSYVRMAFAVKAAQKFNLRVAKAHPSRDEEVVAAIARMISWCESPTMVRGLSHHGVRSTVTPAADGVVMPMAAAARKDGVLFMAYSDLYPEGWSVGGSDIGVFQGAAAALDRVVVNQWNDGRSVVISARTHETVLEAFDNRLASKSVPPEAGSDKLPEGWRR